MTSSSDWCSFMFIIKPFLLLIILLCLSYNHAWADSCSVNHRVNSSLNVRSAPDGNSTVIGSLSRGKIVDCQRVAMSSIWIKIDYYGQTGYVHNHYVNYRITASPSLRAESKHATNETWLGSDSYHYRYRYKLEEMVVGCFLVIVSLSGIAFLIGAQKNRRRNSNSVSDNEIYLQSGERNTNRREIHFFCLLFTVLIWACALSLLGVIEVNREVREWAVIIFPLAYIALVVESFRASTFGYLRNLNPVEDVVSYIRRMP